MMLLDQRHAQIVIVLYVINVLCNGILLLLENLSMLSGCLSVDAFVQDDDGDDKINNNYLKEVHDPSTSLPPTLQIKTFSNSSTSSMRKTNIYYNVAAELGMTTGKKLDLEVSLMSLLVVILSFRMQPT